MQPWCSLKWGKWPFEISLELILCTFYSSGFKLRSKNHFTGYKVCWICVKRGKGSSENSFYMSCVISGWASDKLRAVSFPLFLLVLSLPPSFQTFSGTWCPILVIRVYVRFFCFFFKWLQVKNFTCISVLCREILFLFDLGLLWICNC